MTYILLDEINQTYKFPPINKDNICNYNIDFDRLIKDGYINIDDSLIHLFNEGKGRIQDNTIVDISDTDGYKVKVNTQQDLIQKADLKSQIELLDTKRIRAIAEPSIKDTTTGQTWLDYYTQQIAILRSQI